MANLLIESDYANHGSAFYMLTGTSDFGYLLDIMYEAQMITEDERDTYHSSLDGYRLSYKMAGMYATLDAGDVEAICLYSITAGGCLCAGLTHNTETGDIEPWSEWVSTGAFSISASSAVALVGGVDQSDDWYVLGLEGTTGFIADGTTDSYWTVFKF